MMRFRKKTNLKELLQKAFPEKKSELTQYTNSHITQLKDIFSNDDTIRFRDFVNPYNSRVNCCIVFVNGLVNVETINENIIKPIIRHPFQQEDRVSLEFLQYKLILASNVEKTDDINKLVESIISGDTVLFLENHPEALIIFSKGFQTRSISEPEAEQSLRGPREGFNESLITNLSLVRRKLRTRDLKITFSVVGERSHTRVGICYIAGLADERILQELEKRLKDIQIDGILDSGTIQEFIKDSPFSPFDTVGSSEKPDIIAAKLLEGRIALLVDGSPFVITLPHLFIELFQANEDYYINYYFSSVNRILRILAFLISTSIPAIYLALITFHQEILPTELSVNIAAARQGIPFPSIMVAVGMLIIFELLRETGIRMPTFIGQALNIVGALVVGQAAVEARFISAPMVIIVAVAGLASLMLPRLKGAGLLLQLLYLILASILGLYGYLFGLVGLLIHLFSLRSFGVPYMTSLMTLNPQDLKDTAIRAPWWYMKQRPKLIGMKNYIRQKTERRK